AGKADAKDWTQLAPELEQVLGWGLGPDVGRVADNRPHTRLRDAGGFRSTGCAHRSMNIMSERAGSDRAEPGLQAASTCFVIVSLQLALDALAERERRIGRGQLEVPRGRVRRRKALELAVGADGDRGEGGLVTLVEVALERLPVIAQQDAAYAQAVHQV